MLHRGKSSGPASVILIMSLLQILQTGNIHGPREVAEWLNVAVSKTVVRANVPRVRIPLSPPVLHLLAST